jgi:divalent metal cation (Fe/Co/Zn/Cd) transporter
MTDQSDTKQKFGHGTAETWIVAAASVFIVAIVGFLGRHAWTTLNSLDTSMNNLDRRFISVEAQVQSIQLQLVDVPALKLEQARTEIVIKQLSSEVNDLKRNQRPYP